MVDSCKIFSYSPDNIYANDYYNACKKFDNIRAKVIDYEQKNNDRESSEYQKMMTEFTYWDAKVPETSNIAGAYEDRLAQKQAEKDGISNPINGSRMDYYA